MDLIRPSQGVSRWERFLSKWVNVRSSPPCGALLRGSRGILRQSSSPGLGGTEAPRTAPREDSKREGSGSHSDTAAGSPPRGREKSDATVSPRSRGSGRAEGALGAEVQAAVSGGGGAQGSGGVWPGGPGARDAGPAGARRAHTGRVHPSVFPGCAHDPQQVRCPLSVTPPQTEPLRTDSSRSPCCRELTAELWGVAVGTWGATSSAGLTRVAGRFQAGSSLARSCSRC